MRLPSAIAKAFRSSRKRAGGAGHFRTSTVAPATPTMLTSVSGKNIAHMGTMCVTSAGKMTTTGAIKNGSASTCCAYRFAKCHVLSFGRRRRRRPYAMRNAALTSNAPGIVLFKNAKYTASYSRHATVPAAGRLWSPKPPERTPAMRHATKYASTNASCRNRSHSFGMRLRRSSQSAARANAIHCASTLASRASKARPMLLDLSMDCRLKSETETSTAQSSKAVDPWRDRASIAGADEPCTPPYGLAPTVLVLARRASKSASASSRCCGEWPGLSSSSGPTMSSSLSSSLPSATARCRSVSSSRSSAASSGSSDSGVVAAFFFAVPGGDAGAGSTEVSAAARWLVPNTSESMARRVAVEMVASSSAALCMKVRDVWS
mmetsp:Transcript_41267/g.127443  ORF Transcript_41267/g.127443 Transcript_41267/m.127443 type:complete len:377 (+) Transcript_41267:368-1498(+)